MKPSIPITSKEFKYVNAAQTDIRETFKRVLAAQKVKPSMAQEWLAAEELYAQANGTSTVHIPIRRVK